MSMVVQHNLTAMNSNRMLGITTGAQAKSTEKLSSGYKINRAADDAAGLSISEKMRKQIRGLTQASTNAQDGISAVQTAEGALTEVHDMLQRMNELAVKSANGTNSVSDRDAIQAEIDQLVTEIDRVSETTKFNETYLLKGDVDAEAKTNFAYKDGMVLSKDLYYLKDGKVETVKAGTYQSAVEKLGADIKFFDSSEGDPVGTAIATGDKGTYFTEVDLINQDDLYKKDAEGNYILVEEGSLYTGNASDYYKVTFGADGTVGSAVEQTNVTTTTGLQVKADQTVWDENNVKYTAGMVVSGNVTDYFKDVGTGKFDTADAVTPEYTKSSVVQFMDKDGNEIAANGLYKYINDDGTLKENAELYVKADGTKSGTIKATQEDVDAIVDATKKYTTGALTLKLHVGADATDNNQISVDLDAMSAEGLGIKGLKVDGDDDTNAKNAVETIAAALGRVSEQRSALGAVQNRLEHTISNLDNVVENTTSAESQIRDTDMATEMVNYSKNQILAQAGQSMLAQANQANQGVLSLLQ